MFVMHDEATLQQLAPDTQRRIMAYAEPLMLAEMTMDKGAVGKIHTHPHHQVDYVAKGSVDFTLGSETRRMTAGDSVYIPPEVPHGAISLEDGTILLDIFSPMRKDFL